MSTEILNNLCQLTTSSLKRLKTQIDDILRSRVDQANESFIDHIENFCDDDTLLDIVSAECEAIFDKKISNSSKVTTSWLCDNTSEYSYNHVEDVKSKKKLSEFPGICRLMSRINSCTEVSSVMDCCLAMRYNNNRSSLRPHSDNEHDIIDHTASICTFSLGSSRTIEFFTEERTPKLVCKQRLDNNSLLIMRPGTQQKMKHTVRAIPSINETNEVRYVLSFRKLTKAPHPPNSNAPSPFRQTASSPSINLRNSSTPPCEQVSLILGDSYAARLDPVKLGKGRVKVINLARGGSKITDVIEQISNFQKLPHKTNMRVIKIFVSVGTNDIRHIDTPLSLKNPFKFLFHKLKESFPESKIYFQSLLPLPCRSDRDWDTNTRVLETCKIIINECAYHKFYYIDAFHRFAIPFNARRQDDPRCRNEKLFEKSGIHPNVLRGMGALARLYIKALHSTYFNPFCIQ